LLNGRKPVWHARRRHDDGSDLFRLLVARSGTSSNSQPAAPRGMRRPDRPFQAPGDNHSENEGSHRASLARRRSERSPYRADLAAPAPTDSIDRKDETSSLPPRRSASQNKGTIRRRARPHLTDPLPDAGMARTLIVPNALAARALKHMDDLTAILVKHRSY
jgi:hypothetical protein